MNARLPLAFDATDSLAVDAIRMLCADMVQKAKSGHPGGPMSLADFTYVLWTRFLRHDPSDPGWPDRDRFVLSGGHTSALLYAMLGLFGYLDEEDWTRFRQVGARTPGHPEREIPGVETTTGPLGQGFANAVGLAIAEQVLRQEIGPERLSHRTYVTVGDGDLQEGVAYEAAALAGHLKLGHLLAFFDDNRIQIDGGTELVTSEDIAARFRAQGWHVVETPGHDLAALADAIEAAHAEKDAPSLIIGHTHIGKGLVSLEGSNKTHGAPLGEDEIRATKGKLGLPPGEHFHVPAAVRERLAALRAGLNGASARWRARMGEQGDGLEARLREQPRPALPAALPVYAEGKVATRNASGAFLAAVAPTVGALIGGAADLGGSIQTDPFHKAGVEDLLPGSPGGRHLRFGVREFSMGAISNGIALHGGLLPFCGTFLVFADYMKPAIRLAAMMGLRVVYVFTHDSFYLGEDGPTHQPVEHLAMLRAIPGLTVFRPADGNETIAAWRWALEEADGPVALALTRQGLPTLDRQGGEPTRGAYVLSGAEWDRPELVLIASGSEVGPSLAAARTLTEEGRRVRVVNMVSWERFAAQEERYRHQVLPPACQLRLAVEAGTSQGWERWLGALGECHCFNRFGASGPAEELAHLFGFDSEGVLAHARAILADAPARAAALRAALAG